MICIKNIGIPNLEDLTLLGVSTSRGKIGKIGQFGSGAKIGIATLLRFNDAPISVWLGKTLCVFRTVPVSAGGRTYNKVVIDVDGKRLATSMTTEFGAMDWDTPEYGLRELIANALDAGEPRVFVGRGVPEENNTTIEVPETPRLLRMVKNLKKWFMHYGDQKPDVQGFVWDEEGGNIYVRGVLVANGLDCGFSYNTLNEAVLTESRKLAPYTENRVMLDVICGLDDHKEAEKFLRGLNPDKMEFRLDHGYTMHKKVWEKAAFNVFGDVVAVCYKEHADFLAKREIKYVAVPPLIYGWLTYTNFPTYKTIVKKTDEVEAEPCRKEVQREADFVWKKLESVGVTEGMRQPKICEGRFRVVGVEGMYLDGMVVVRKDTEVGETMQKVLIEEYAHHITGASDATRTLQNWYLKLAYKALYG